MFPFSSFGLRVFFFVSLFFTYLCSGSQVLLPVNLSNVAFPTPLLHQHIGAVPFAEPIVAQLSYATHLEMCEEEVMAKVNGTVVLLDVLDYYFKSLHMQQEKMLCAQRAGAKGIFVNYHNILVPGFTLYFNQNVKNKLSIPALNTADPDVVDIITALKAGQNITVSMNLDPNEWQKLWESKPFFLGWWVFLPIVNILGIINGLSTLSTHFFVKRNSLPDAPVTPYVRHLQQSNKKLMLSGCFFELLGFVLRLIYCLSSPLYSNAALPYSGQVFLINLSMPQEVSAALICTCLFLRWGAFGKLRRAKYFERGMLWFAFTLATPLTVAVSLLGYYRITSPFIMVVMYGLLMIVSLATCVLFIVYGMFFITRLNHRVGDENKLSSKRVRALSKAVRWIMLSGVMQIVVLIATASALNVEFFYRPFGFNVCYLLLYTGVSLQGAIQIVAFRRPMSQRLTTTSFSSTRQSVVSAVSHTMRVLKFGVSIDTTPETVHRGVSKAHVILPSLPMTQSDTSLSRKRPVRARPRSINRADVMRPVREGSTKMPHSENELQCIVLHVPEPSSPPQPVLTIPERSDSNRISSPRETLVKRMLRQATWQPRLRTNRFSDEEVNDNDNDKADDNERQPLQADMDSPREMLSQMSAPALLMSSFDPEFDDYL